MPARGERRLPGIFSSFWGIHDLPSITERGVMPLEADRRFSQALIDPDFPAVQPRRKEGHEEGTRNSDPGDFDGGRFERDGGERT
jgi:hypothetical protein